MFHEGHVLHIRQDSLDQLVRQNAGSISKAKQGVVREHHLHMVRGEACEKMGRSTAATGGWA